MLLSQLSEPPSVAVSWRANPIRKVVRDVFFQHGIDVDSGVFFSVSDREYEQHCTFGTFVTADERFIEFDIELSPDGENLVDVTTFKDVTEQQDICSHKPGVGATLAFLTLEVLRELNKENESDCNDE